MSAAPPVVEELLPPDLASPAAARRLVREALERAGRPEWSESASLAVSELVTNAVLHAHTDVMVRVLVESDEARVEVLDANPRPPNQRTYDAQATTGRGMALVAALTSEHGVTPLGELGKCVWFVLDDRAQQQDEDALLAAWGDADWELDLAPEPPVAEQDAETVTVRLRDLPPVLWLAAREHHDALLRELVLHLATHDDVEVDLRQADEARTRVSQAVEEAVSAAQGRREAEPVLPNGHPSPLPWAPQRVDLELVMEQTAPAAFAALQDALDAAERLAVDGRLLARPGLPEIVAVRDWVCEQVQSQVHDVAARPWPGTAQSRFETAANPREDDPDWDLEEVLTCGRGVVAADDANRIVGISAPLAAALGWDPAELLGRRVVTLIPPSLREAHVAGFTRHLTTGEAHVIDMPLELPVQHADGHEVLCRFLVQQAQAVEGRVLYLAWIEPVAS